MDSLEEIPRCDWPKLLTLYKSNWPGGLYGYSLLDLHLEYPDLSIDFNLKVYCPGGNVENGMVAISDKIYYCLFVHPLNNDTSAIEHALITTHKVDWNHNVTVYCTEYDTVECLRRVSERLSLQVCEKTGLVFTLDKDSNFRDVSNVPLNTYVAAMRPEFLDLIDQSWGLYIPGYSREILEILAKNGLSYVLYSLKDDKPIAWMFIDMAGVLTHVYCHEKFRKQGYTRYLLDVVTNNMLKQGKCLNAHIVVENVISRRLFQKSGFKFSGNVVKMCLNKKNGLKLISSSSSSAVRRPLLDRGLSQC